MFKVKVFTLFLLTAPILGWAARDVYFPILPTTQGDPIHITLQNPSTVSQTITVTIQGTGSFKIDDTTGSYIGYSNSSGMQENPWTFTGTSGRRDKAEFTVALAAAELITFTVRNTCVGSACPRSEFKSGLTGKVHINENSGFLIGNVVTREANTDAAGSAYPIQGGRPF